MRADTAGGKPRRLPSKFVNRTVVAALCQDGAGQFDAEKRAYSKRLDRRATVCGREIGSVRYGAGLKVRFRLWAAVPNDLSFWCVWAAPGFVLWRVVWRRLVCKKDLQDLVVLSYQNITNTGAKGTVK